MKIIKSFRKSITMKVEKDWIIIIKAPFFTSKKIIDTFLEKNKNWIEERKNEIIKRFREFKEGEKFFFFWEEYEFKFDNKSEKIYFDGLFFYLNKKHKDRLREKFIEFYKYEAKKYIEKRITEISKENNLVFNSFKITSAKTRWGSCTSRKNLNFTYRLIMTPMKTIDYVIIHELAHLVEMNHSKNFWDLVEKMSKKMYPGDYKIHKKWLTDNGNKLMY